MLWAVGGFLTFTLAVGVVVEVWCPDWLDREYQVRRAVLRERLREDPGRPTVLVVGSSRMVTAFMPERMSPLTDAAGRDVLVFNYSHLGAGPRLNLVQVRRALRDGARPEWLILEVNLGQLNRDYLPSREATLGDVWALARYEPQRARLLYNAATTRATIVHRVRTPLVEWAAPPFVTRPERHPDSRVLHLGGADGWARVDHPTPEYTDRYRRIAEETQKRVMDQVRPSAYTADVMRDILAFCRDHGIQAVLLLTPEDRLYLSWYGRGVEEALQSWLAEFRDEFGVPVVDARRWVRDDGFSDPHHVNLKGAQVFTDRLAAEVIRPLVQTGRMEPGAGD